MALLMSLLGLLLPGLVSAEGSRVFLTQSECTFQAVTAPKLPIPPSSVYTTIGISIFVAVVVIAKHLWIPKKYWVWIPNWNAVGLVSTRNDYEGSGTRGTHPLQGFIVPQVQLSIFMGLGSVLAYVWLRKDPRVGYS